MLGRVAQQVGVSPLAVSSLGDELALRGLALGSLTGTLNSPLALDLLRSGLNTRGLASSAVNLGIASTAAIFQETLGRIFQHRHRYGGPYPHGLSLIYLADRLLPGFDATRFQHDDILAMELPSHFAEPVVINGLPLGRARNLKDLLNRAQDLHEIFRKSNHTTLEYGDRIYSGTTCELGRGAMGVVYAVGSDHVIKLPYPNYDSLAIALAEVMPSLFWELQSLGKRFRAVKRYSTHPCGIFSILQRAPGTTFMQYLIDRSMVVFDRTGKSTLSYHPEDRGLKDLWEAMADFMDVIRRYPALSYDAVPDNIHVYMDGDGRLVTTLIDLGPPLRNLVPTSGLTFQTLRRSLPTFAGVHPEYERMTERELVEALATEGFPSFDLGEEKFLYLSEIQQAQSLADYMSLAESRMKKRGLLFSQNSQARFMDCEIEVGDVIGISNRSGLTPFLVQLGDLSPLDHVGIVIQEDGRFYLTQYTHAKGVHMQPMAEVEERVREKGLHFVIGRYPYLLSADLKRLLSNRVEAIVERPTGNGVNCALFVQEVFTQCGLKVGTRYPISALNHRAIGGLLIKLAGHVPGAENSVTPFSIIEDLVVVGHNFDDPNQIVRWDEEAFYAAWEQDGDVAKVAAVMGPLMVHADQRSASFQRYFRLMAKKNSSEV